MDSYIESHPFLVEDQSTGYLYYLTCVSNVTATRAAVVTQYPTVSGKSISDNMYVQPKTCTFQVMVSSIYGTQQKYVNPVTKNTVQLTAEEVKNAIILWQEDAVRLNITTFEDSFSNMVVNNIATNEDGSSGIGTWSATLQFTEVRVAQIQEVKLDFPETPEESANNNSETNLGADNGSVAAEVGSFVGNVGGGAALGAAVGSVIPGIGTAVGAVGGAVVGFFSWLFS